MAHCDKSIWLRKTFKRFYNDGRHQKDEGQDGPLKVLDLNGPTVKMGLVNRLDRHGNS